MTGQNNRQDWSLTGQVSDQAGHCPLIGRYFQPSGLSGGKILTAKELLFRLLQ